MFFYKLYGIVVFWESASLILSLGNICKKNDTKNCKKKKIQFDPTLTYFLLFIILLIQVLREAEPLEEFKSND
jgi:hypothetical protein